VLDHHALINGTVKNAPRLYLLHLDDTGALPDGTRVWGNDELMFQGSMYIATLFDQFDTIQFGPQLVPICGDSPINLNCVIPFCGEICGAH
jgi:hypothetical protein